MSDKELSRIIARKLAEADTDIEKLLSNADKSLLKIYKQALDDIRADLQRLAERYPEGNPVLIPAREELERQIKIKIDQLTYRVKGIINSTLKDTFTSNYYQTAYAFESSMGLNLGFGMLNASVIEASVLNSFDKITWVNRLDGWNQIAYAEIRKSLTKGLILGQGYGKIGKDIKERLDISAGRAIRIARTEGHRVQSVARLDAIDKTTSAAERLGIEVTRIWTATLDNRTRDTHADLDGQAASEDGFYTISGITTEAPGLSGVPEFDINCRCTERTEIKGYETNVRRDNISKELIEYQTYKDWYNGRIGLNKDGQEYV
jgi:SPP1 gp7 family putative phage head morphogenesis protein